MKIKHKITYNTTLWLILILILFNLIVYFAFHRITTENEEYLLAGRAQALLQRVSPVDLMQGAKSELLESFLPDNGSIRLINSAGQVVQAFKNNDQIGADKYMELVQTPVTEEYETGKLKLLTVRIPILSNNEVIGNLEMAEVLDSLEENISILISIMAFTTLGALCMSLISGVWLSKFILRPISGMIHTMEEIEQSLVFRKIPLNPNTKDELTAMASTFNRMMDRIEDSFIRQKQFVSDASHELKTPLTIIEGYSSMLRRWGWKDQSIGLEAVDAIYTEAVHMKRITQQLLELASIENEQEPAKERIELVAFSKGCVALLCKLYKRNIDVQSVSNELYLRADPLKLKQLLLILLDNALKYSQTDIRLTLSEHPQQRGVEIRVIDKGIGIPKDDLDRVFERFYRVDSARNRKSGGSGLGLSIARNITRLHQGTIGIVSDEQIGTEVIVFIPYE